MNKFMNKSMAMAMAAMTLVGSMGAVAATEIPVEDPVASVEVVETSNVGKDADGNIVKIGSGDQDNGVTGHSDFNANTTVTGEVSPITTLDVTIPVGGINFAIDSNAQISSVGVVIASDTAVPLQVNMISAEAMAAGDETNGLAATNMQAPALVLASSKTADEWNNLKRAETHAEIAIGLKQVDVVGDADAGYEAGAELTDATTDVDKITTVVEMADIDNSEICHLVSGFDETARAAINLDLDRQYTDYGKAWGAVDDSGLNTFRYNIVLECIIE